MALCLVVATVILVSGTAGGREAGVPYFAHYDPKAFDDAIGDRWADRECFDDDITVVVLRFRPHAVRG